MEYFLKEHRRQKLINDLKAVNVPEHMAETVAGIPLGQHDNHLRAHAYCCIKGAKDGGKQGAAFILLSAICMDAIQAEAKERGMGRNDFPTTASVMDAFIAMNESLQSGKKPH